MLHFERLVEMVKSIVEILRLSFEELRWCKDSTRAIALLLSQSVREYFQEYRNRFVWQVCVCTLVFIRTDILAYLSQIVAVIIIAVVSSFYWNSDGI